MPPEDDEELSQVDELNDLNSVIVEPEAPEPEPPDEDDEEPGTTPAPGARPSRKERRGQRSAGYNEMKETSERQARELQETRLAMARMEGLMQANMRQPQQGPHPAETDVRNVLRDQHVWYQKYSADMASGKMSQEAMRAAEREAEDLEIRKGVAISRLAMVQSGVGQAPNQQQVRAMAFQEQLNMRYSDIAADPKATEIGGHIARRMFAEGKPQTWETLDEAAEETRKLMNWKSARTPPKPSETTKAKFIATGKGPGAGGSTNESKPIRITKKQATMAENAYPNLSPEKARQKWWNEVGKKYA